MSVNSMMKKILLLLTIILNW